MKIGLKTGARGEEVQRLQKILVSEGHEISRNEIEQNAFGPSTLAALKAFQTRHSLRQSNQITRATLNVLLELEENVIININQASTAPPTAKPAKDRGSVTGKLVDGDGNPIVNTRVSLFEMQLRTEKPLGNTKSNKQGQYAVSYRRTAAINLVARAYNATGEVLAQSATQFAAATVEIDLTTAKDGVVRTPSFFTTLEAQVAAQLQGTPLQDLKQNQDEQDLQFLASSIGAQFNDVAYLFIAHVLGQQEHLQDATLFGIFYQGIPPSLEAALGNLPDSGIDATFMAQVLSSVLTHSDALLAQALTTAVSANVLPASYAGVQASEIALLDALRVQNMGNTPYLTGKTTLNALLAAGSVVPAVQTAFTTAYASNDGQLGPTWTCSARIRTWPRRIWTRSARPCNWANCSRATCRWWQTPFNAFHRKRWRACRIWRCSAKATGWPASRPLTRKLPASRRYCRRTRRSKASPILPRCWSPASLKGIQRRHLRADWRLRGRTPPLRHIRNSARF